MIVNAWGVVLDRRVFGEADRLATLYTETLGKLSVRFVGVNKPGAKLKALSEPAVWGEYRLYLSPRTDMAKAIGGRLISCFPGVRDDLSRTIAALSCCELMKLLTPERSPNPDKYRLLCSTLAALDAGGGPWLEIAYGLRLLELCGFGVRDVPVPESDRLAWTSLHEAPLDDLEGLPWRDESAERFQSILYGHAEAQAGRALKTRDFIRQLGGGVALAC